jgi:PhnB protein
MKAVQPYLNFDGNTRDAMTFYNECFDGELSIQTFGDVHAPGPPGSESRVMHARVTKGPVMLMASDTMPGMPFAQGNDIHINIDCESAEEIETLFGALGQGGKVTMPLQDQFWGARFGMLVDKFGIHWMFNYELPKQA